MTVAQLIKRLEREDPARLVVMAIDPRARGPRALSLARSAWLPEGNVYHPLDGHYAAVYTRNGDVGLEKLTPADRKRGYTDDDVRSAHRERDTYATLAEHFAKARPGWTLISVTLWPEPRS